SDIYNLQLERPTPLVPSRWRLELAERLDWTGEVIKELDLSEVRSRVTSLVNQGIDSIAVCLLHSYRNPVHELEVKRLIESEFPNISVSISSDISPVWREFERTSTTVLNASLIPVVGKYLDRMVQKASKAEIPASIMIMQSNGGVMTVADIMERPLACVMSGPAGGVAGAAATARALNIDQLISFDMGGTSADISVILNGRPAVREEAYHGEWPIQIDQIDVNSVGAGGGLIAHIGEGGTFLVGPQSAGAEPGPACYGKGGTQATVTDANVLLGRIDPDFFSGGLDIDAAKQAVQRRISDHLGMTIIEAAHGIITINNSVMTAAIRQVLAERGIVPSESTLLAFGGSGGLHACTVAQELEIRRVIVPPMAGNFSAWGILQSDVRYDLVQMMVERVSAVDQDRVNRVLAALTERGARQVSTAGISDSDIQTECYASLSYVGQDYFLKVPVDYPVRDMDKMAHDFEEAYERSYGHVLEGFAVQLKAMMVSTIGRIPQGVPFQSKAVSGSGTAEEKAIKGYHEVYLDDKKSFARCPTYDRQRFLPGYTLSGPAVIAEPGATTFILPGCLAHVDEYQNVVIEMGG
ncbi:MAG: hydantoinase/oxoprolinase family protein, partial [Candidatus Odinarchaeota archaeon]